MTGGLGKGVCFTLVALVGMEVTGEWTSRSIMGQAVSWFGVLYVYAASTMPDPVGELYALGPVLGIAATR
jgi:hypothetical protein